MRRVVRIVIVMAAVLQAGSAVAQSKKEIIATQSVVLDSITHVAQQQHAAILQATERIQALNTDLDACRASLRAEHERNDSLRRASSMAYGTLLRERDSLFVQHRTVENRLRRLVNGQQGYVCVMPFSMRGLSDTLALEQAGPDMLSAVFTFRIIDWRGQEIYSAPVELQRDEEVMDDDRLQRCALEARILAFFQDRRFEYPPIGPERDRQHSQAIANGTYYSISPDEWNALLFDAHSCAFSFPVNAKTSHTVAYSAKLKRVVRLDAGAGVR